MNPFSIAAAKALSFATQSMSDAVECVNKIMLNSVSANCNVTTFRKIPPADNLFASTGSMLVCDSTKVDPYMHLRNTLDSIRMFGITYNPDLLHECTGQEVLTSRMLYRVKEMSYYMNIMFQIMMIVSKTL
ncbi:hypothetical protein OTT_1648 [Orientia tsutsugamushi str. Ikeda]|uniref:Uncharacterized protein n=1 Tax=Orientia tsutsugamushi (strain Ikeda) TaxID=334380 RepID=B3CT91_ORITI|nr:hypothetical protein [Orientia tsutsugamushi]BAG40588.1 hypothetical protein OTT_1130 [Orientia tsutsugamushi str. Ikeda]BAG41106.1 hypothetical protein OTT_1648 [Orientia tsutsugamushi str. Ikeda]